MSIKDNEFQKDPNKYLIHVLCKTKGNIFNNCWNPSIALLSPSQGQEDKKKSTQNLHMPYFVEWQIPNHQQVASSKWMEFESWWVSQQMHCPSAHENPIHARLTSSNRVNWGISKNYFFKKKEEGRRQHWQREEKKEWVGVVRKRIVH